MRAYSFSGTVHYGGRALRRQHKPAEDASLSTIRLIELIEEAGFL